MHFAIIQKMALPKVIPLQIFYETNVHAIDKNAENIIRRLCGFETPRTICTPVKLFDKTLSKEMMIQKNFQSVLLKLTDSNKQRLFENLKTIICKDYLDIYIGILINLMQKQRKFQDIYMELIEYFFADDECKSRWKSVWDNYNFWIPMKNRETIPNSDDDYDAYCDYVKQRELSVNGALMWAKFQNKGVLKEIDVYGKLVEITYSIIEKGDYRDRLDCIFQQLLEILELGLKPDVNIVQSIHGLNTDGLSYNCRFKLIDIKEKLMTLM